MRRNLKL